MSDDVMSTKLVEELREWAEAKQHPHFVQLCKSHEMLREQRVDKDSHKWEDPRWATAHRPGEPHYERIAALQPFPMTSEQLASRFEDEDMRSLVTDLQAVMEPAFSCCPWCGHSGPLFSMGDHWQDCKFLAFMIENGIPC